MTIRTAREDMNNKAAHAYDNETTENVMSFWEAYKHFHIETGRLNEMRRGG